MCQFTPCGLIFDAAGVLLLGWAFFSKGFEQMTFTADGFKLDVDLASCRDAAKQKIDGMVGTSILFLGFLYQFFGYLHFQQPFIVSASYSLLLIFLCAYFAWGRKQFIESWMKRALTVEKQESLGTSA